MDKEASDAEIRVLNLHLSQCPECDELYHQLCQIEKGINLIIEFFPKHDFNQRVMAELGYAPEKVTIQKPFAWKKLTAVLSGAWIISVIGFLVSPLPKILLSKTLVSTPALVNIFEKVSILFTGIKEVFAPFIKAGFRPLFPITGAVVTLITVYMLSKTTKNKEETCSV